MTSTNYNAALALAIEIHGEQIRKGTQLTQKHPTPYISHLVAVSVLVLRYGGEEEHAIAGLLHDALEDGGEEWAVRIEPFGERVMRIVRDCTDGVPDADGEKEPWKPRKEKYIEHVRSEVGPDTLLVSAADKLHNLTSIRQDLEELGMSVFERFTATPDETMWYYRALIEAFRSRAVHPHLMRQLDVEVAAIERMRGGNEVEG
jgi:GTP pyrophosphokinase